MVCHSKFVRPDGCSPSSLVALAFAALFPRLVKTATTESLSKTELEERRWDYVGAISVGIFLLTAAAVAVSFRKTGRLAVGPLVVVSGEGVYWKGQLKHAFINGGLSFAANEPIISEEQEEHQKLLPQVSTGDTRSEMGPSEISQKDWKKLQDLHRDLVNSHRNFLRLRDGVLAGLLLIYIGSSIGLPLWNARTVSCDHGFFWETHMMFFLIFLLTKVVELFLYAADSTLDGELDVLTFILKFVLSFIGYADGYMDATAIVIGNACPDDFAKRLSFYMAITYVLGVVLLQWVIMTGLAVRDPSRACVMKLLHMDALASCVTLPDEHKNTWNAIHASRTLGEDIPQGIEQTFFVLKVRKNYFMVVSIIGGVASSIKAFYDAYNRALEAAGAWAKLRELEAATAPAAEPEVNHPAEEEPPVVNLDGEMQAEQEEIGEAPKSDTAAASSEAAAPVPTRATPKCPLSGHPPSGSGPYCYGTGDCCGYNQCQASSVLVRNQRCPWPCKRGLPQCFYHATRGNTCGLCQQRSVAGKGPYCQSNGAHCLQQCSEQSVLPGGGRCPWPVGPDGRLCLHHG